MRGGILRRGVLAGLGLITLGILPALADYQAGLEAYKKGDLKQALEQFQQEIQRHPNYDYGHFMLGICYLRQKQYPQAVASLRRAAELDKEKLVYHTNLAQAYTEQKQWQDVVETLEGKVELRAEPNVAAQAHLLLGVGYLNVKQPEKAADELEAARKLTPNDFRILSPLGVAQHLRGDYDAAISALSAARKIDPKHTQTLQYLGEAYLAKAQRETDKQKKQLLYQSATKLAEENLRLSGNNDFDAVNLLARAYLGADRFQEAVAAFEKAIALKPDHGYAHFNRGEAFKGLKDWAGAEKEYARAVELMPGDGDVHATLAYAYEQVAKQDRGASLDKALAAYQKSNSLKPKASTREAIARVLQNIQIREENRVIWAENQKIEEENARRQAEYQVKLKEAEEYEKRRKQYLEDKGLVEKEKPAQPSTPPTPPQGSQN